mmetsp:Transcript_20910/g.23310  ORF Transcript_20910/g.23310 Transcript_20910/m.23310 type:complete len:113 (+) Transcript_20910:197-535(+)
MMMTVQMNQAVKVLVQVVIAGDVRENDLNHVRHLFHQVRRTHHANEAPEDTSLVLHEEEDLVIALDLAPVTNHTSALDHVTDIEVNEGVTIVNQSVIGINEDQVAEETSNKK